VLALSALAVPGSFTTDRLWGQELARPTHERKRAPSPTQSPRPALFRDIAAQVGLDFFHVNGVTGRYYMPEIMGSGVALFDYDNDGALDVYFVQGAQLDPRGRLLYPPPPGFKPGNRLFRNLLAETGKLRFVDVTEKAGVGHIGCGMGVAVGDYDNDGFQDLYVTNFGHNVLYHNNGDGTFTDVTAGAGVDDDRWSTCAAWLDFDGDGWLDLFVGNYVDFTVAGNKSCYSSTGELDYCTPRAYRAVSPRLFKNRRNGKFEDVTESSGIGSSFGPALGVVCADFNGDGRVDIYIANDTASNRLWINQGDGTFKEVGLETGVALSADGLPKAGMGVSLADFENRGREGLIVTNLTREGATLFASDGRGNFDDVTAEYGLLEPTMESTGFGTEWFDYDNDGWLDLFMANGAVTRMDSESGSRFPFAQRNQLFHNEGAARRFRDVSPDAGPAFQRLAVSRGAAFGDIDNDGALDIVVTDNNGAAMLLKNEVGSKNHWLQVRLEGAGTNLFGVGAVVGVFREGQPTLWRRAHTDSSYLSASDIRVHFGLGQRPRIDGVVVHWPNGSKEKWTGVQPDRIVKLRQGSGIRL
jgi:hypothetical protein